MNAPLFSQAAAVTVKILLFRAGPQDFPHAREFVAPLPLAAILAYFALFAVVIPPAPSLVLGALSVGALALVTHSLLSVRRVVNRFQQTYHALLATGLVLTLASILPMTALAPALHQIAAGAKPADVQASPLASLALNLLNIWNFAVYAHIFRHAAGTRLLTGALIALFVVFSVLLLSLIAAQMILPMVR